MSAILSHLSTAKTHVSSGKSILSTLGKETSSLEKNSFFNFDKERESGFSEEGYKGSVGDSYTRNQHKVTSKSAFETDFKTLKDRPLDRSHWEQKGFAIERQDWNKTTAKVDTMPSKTEKSWMSKHVDVGGEIASTQGSIEASVWKNEWGSEHNKLTVDALGGELEGSASLNVGLDGINANLSGHAEVYLLRAEYEGKYGPLSAQGKAYIGAEANAGLDVNFNPMKGEVNASAGVDAFAGGKAEGNVAIGNEYGSVGANAGVSYGIGFEAGADVGIKDGKVALDLDLGATVGLGGNIGFEGEIDVANTAKGAVNGAKDAAGGVKDLTGKIPLTPW